MEDATIEQLKDVTIEVIAQAVRWEDGNEVVRACARTLGACTRKISRPEHVQDRLEIAFECCKELRKQLAATNMVKNYNRGRPHPLATAVSLVLHDLRDALGLESIECTTLYAPHVGTTETPQKACTTTQDA